MTAKVKRAWRIGRRLAVGIVLGAGLFLVGSALSRYARAFDVFSLERIEIVGNHIVDSETVMRESGLEFGMGLGDLQPKNVEARLLGNPYFSKIRVGRSYPGTIRIAVMERKPIAYLSLESLYCVDREGVLLPVVGPRGPDLPVITGLEQTRRPQLGGKVEAAEVHVGTWIVKRLHDSSYPLEDVISEVHFSATGDVDLIGVGGGAVVHLGNRDYGRRIAALAGFLSRAPMREGLAGYQYIDLRYKNQVVVRERRVTKRG